MVLLRRSHGLRRELSHARHDGRSHAVDMCPRAGDRRTGHRPDLGVSRDRGRRQRPEVYQLRHPEQGHRDVGQRQCRQRSRRRHGQRGGAERVGERQHVESRKHCEAEERKPTMSLRSPQRQHAEALCFRTTHADPHFGVVRRDRHLYPKLSIDAASFEQRLRFDSGCVLQTRHPGAGSQPTMLDSCARGSEAERANSGCDTRFVVGSHPAARFETAARSPVHGAVEHRRRRRRCVRRSCSSSPTRACRASQREAPAFVTESERLPFAVAVRVSVAEYEPLPSNTGVMMRRRRTERSACRSSR